MPINTPTGYLDITNATLRGSKIVTTGNIGIANANPVNHLSVGSNLHINDTHSNVLQISGNINAASVVLGGISIAPTFDLEIITNTGNTTPYTVEFNNTATAFVTTANATIGDTLTASKLVGDGSGISAIQSSNVTDFGSNVSRITTLESSRALKTDLDNNSARITNLSSNLSDNSSRITTLESGDISISGDKTFTGEIIFESNIHMNGGNVLVANTVNMTVSDPIIELGSNNLNTNDLGIIMTRHGATNSNIALVYDESDDILRMGYTLNGASDSIISLDSNALSVSVQGALSAASVTTDDYLIHGGDTDTKVGFPLADTFTVTTSNSERLRVDSSGNVGISTTTPTSKLELAADGGSSMITLKRTNASNNGSKGGLRFTENTNGYNVGVIACLGDGANTSGALCFYTAASSTDSNVYLPTTDERMRISSGGNVGIGTSSPIAALDIDGGANDDTTPALAIKGGLYDTSDLYVLNSYNVNTGVGYGAKVIGVNIKNKVETDNTIQIRNNVGGLTSAGAIYFGTDEMNQGIFGVLGGTGTAGTTLSEHLTVRSNGRVGIGTATPGAKLDVQFTGDDGIRVKNAGTSHASVYIDAASGYSYLRFQGSGVDKFWIQSTPTGDLAFRPSGGSHVMDIKNNGFVGIGETSPVGGLDLTPNRKLKFSDDGSYLSGPTNSTLGGNGSRMVLWSGSSTSVPYGFGMESGNIWMSTPSGMKFYVGTTSKVQIDGNGLTTTNSGSLYVANPGVLDFGTSVRQMINLWSTHYGIGIQSNTTYFRSADHFAFHRGGSHSATALDPGSGGTALMVIRSNGNVGIGTNTPLAALDVPHNASGTVSVNNNQGGYWFSWNTAGTKFYNNQTPISVSGNFDGGSVTAHTFYAGYSIQFLSDRRIKKDIREIDDESALEKFRLLKPSKYKYIEPLLSGRTDKEVYGFIAQEVAEVLPEGVTIGGSVKDGTNQGHIPNIMSMCSIESQNISSDAYENLGTEQKGDYIETGNTYTRHIVTITKTIDPSTFNVDGSTSSYKFVEQTKTTGAFDKNSDDKYHPLVFYGKDLKTIRADVVRVIDDSSFVVDKKLDLNQYEDGELLLYGQKPDDFYRLNKDSIFTLASAALQEVDRQLQAEKTKTATLETQVAALLERVTALENA